MLHFGKEANEILYTWLKLQAAVNIFLKLFSAK